MFHLFFFVVQPMYNSNLHHYCTMSQCSRLISELSALSPAAQQQKLLLVAAAIHRDACKVTKDTIDAYIRALGK